MSNEIRKLYIETNELVEIKVTDEQGHILIHATFALKGMELKPIIHSGRQAKRETQIIFTNRY